MSRIDDLVGEVVETFEYSWTSDDALLYAVGVGAGQVDPSAELQFTTENSVEVTQQVLPSFVSLMQSGKWLTKLPLKEGEWDDWGYPKGTVHGEQAVRLNGPLPSEGDATVTVRLAEVLDKGSGAVTVAECEVADKGSGDVLAVGTSTYFIRGQGGFGGERGSSSPWEIPDRAADITVSDPTRPNQSLVYRLSGDRNPHCSDPVRAVEDGFERPIFQGLGSFGFACRALVNELCEGDVSRFGAMSARFADVVYPGDLLETEIWREDGGAIFQTSARGRGLVLDRGTFKEAG